MIELAAPIPPRRRALRRGDVKPERGRIAAGPEPLPRVGRMSVSDAVADHIRRLVFFGELEDGQRVPQREIAEALGVSSVPVREALAGLQQEWPALQNRVRSRSWALVRSIFPWQHHSILGAVSSES